MIIQNYHFAGELARTHIQELQHEAYVAKLAHQGLASKSGAFFANLRNNKDRLAKHLYGGKAILLKGSDRSNYHRKHSGG